MTHGDGYDGDVVREYDCDGDDGGGDDDQKCASPIVISAKLQDIIVKQRNAVLCVMKGNHIRLADSLGSSIIEENVIDERRSSNQSRNN